MEVAKAVNSAYKNLANIIKILPAQYILGIDSIRDKSNRIFSKFLVEQYKRQLESIKRDRKKKSRAS